MKQMGGFSPQVSYSWREGTRPTHGTCTHVCVAGVLSATMTDTRPGRASLRGGLATPCCVPRSSKRHQVQQASTHRGMQQSLGIRLPHGASLQREALYLPSLGKE